MITRLNRFNAVPGYMEGEPGPAAGGGDPGAWLSGLPEDLRGHDSLKPFAGKPLDELVKGYMSTQQMLGTRIPIPADNADPAVLKEFQTKIGKVPGVTILPGAEDAEGWKGFYSKLGVPETPDAYGNVLPEKMPDGVQVDAEAMKPIIAELHKLNLTPAQMRGIVQVRINEVAKGYEAASVAQQAAAAQLKTEWGAGYEQNMGIARVAAEKQFGADAEQLIELSQHVPAIAKALHKIGTLTMDDQLLRTFGPGGQPLRNVQEVDAELSSVMADSAYLNSNDPRHKEVMARVTKLQQEMTRVRGG